MKIVSSFLICFFICLSAFNQAAKTENIVVVTYDGLRWQEVFGGADPALVFDTTAKYNTDYVKKRFWAPTATERRKILMPFFWSVLQQQGSIYGNRELGSYVNNANSYWFSYPGYNEIFTGYPDTAVNSNDKIPNPNQNVFEFMSKSPGFKGKTAVFASWDVFSYIFNEKRSGVYVNDGFKDVTGKLSERQVLFNEMQHQMPDLFHGPAERLDIATFNMGMEYMKENKPRLMYFAFGDTDEFAHAGLYDFYLDAANKTDHWIRQIWNYINSDPFYKGKTTLIITTDHGRGEAANGAWQSHGSKVTGADQMWMAAIGNNVKAAGESSKKQQIYQGQVAATIAALLGTTFNPTHTVLPAINFTIK